MSADQLQGAWGIRPDTVASPLWHEGCAVLLENSGQTLALDALGASMLGHLLGGPASEASLCDHVSAMLEVRTERECDQIAQRVHQSLLEFERLDILCRHP